MKALILTLALLTGDSAWPGSTETYFGLTCGHMQDVRTISRVAQAYSLRDTIETRTNCLHMGFDGRKVGETAVFGVGSRLYTFWIIEVEGGRVYLLHDEGEGYLA